MHIVHIAAECAPLAKVGGLGDVVLGLSREQAKGSDRVEVFLPKYGAIHWHHIQGKVSSAAVFSTRFGKKSYRNTLWRADYKNFTVYFIDPHALNFYSRGGIYGYPDDIDRFLYFSRSVFDWFQERGEEPDVFHLHDWQAALLAPLWKKKRKKSGAKILFTCHNLAYQGIAKPLHLKRAGIASPLGLEDDFSLRGVNLVKGAMLYSDAVTTVSPTYAKEMLTTEIHRDFLPTLRACKSKLKGILNGLDIGYWNPEIDMYLPLHFSSRSLERKKELKELLRRRLNLSSGPMPIVASVSRLVPQKGIALIQHALNYCLDAGAQFVLLGSAPEPKTQKQFEALARRWRNHPRVSLTLQPDEELTHYIFGGSDLFIVPSLFEPCGLTQLIALKYGTLPVVRKTGGLADTIIDVDEERGNGFVFHKSSRLALQKALKRAFDCWREEPKRWEKIQKRGMSQDFSWEKPAAAYRELYQKMRL